MTMDPEGLLRRCHNVPMQTSCTLTAKQQATLQFSIDGPRMDQGPIRVWIKVRYWCLVGGLLRPTGPRSAHDRSHFCEAPFDGFPYNPIRKPHEKDRAVSEYAMPGRILRNSFG